MSPEIAAYFNQIARPDDLALVPAARLRLLPLISAGQVRIGFASWAQAERDLPALADQIDVVAYNPEHWAQTPSEEQQNLLATVQRAAEFAHSLGLTFMVSPDRRFAQDYLAQIAPYADLIGLQGQRLQHDPQAFAEWVQEMITIVRISNPDALIFVQVSSNLGSATEMLAAIQTVAEDIDGISVWTSPQTYPVLQEFVGLLR